MNPEIYAILEDMKKHQPKGTSINDSDYQTYLKIQSSHLSVLLAEENEKSSGKVIKLTEKLVHLTYAIIALTVVLLFQGFFEFPKFQIPFHISQQDNQKTQYADQNNLPNQQKPTVATIKN